MAKTRLRRARKHGISMLLRKPEKVRERLHVLRLKFKPGYATKYLQSIGFTENEIKELKKKKGYGD
jgi:hypothetical protein